jgi:hypothetical protein
MREKTVYLSDVLKILQKIVLLQMLLGESVITLYLKKSETGEIIYTPNKTLQDQECKQYMASNGCATSLFYTKYTV